MRIPLSLRVITLFVTAVSFFSCQNQDNHGNEKEKSSSFQRFSLLNPQNTGIHFVNKITEGSNINYFSANYIYIGGGVGAGDFNNDGLTDLYFVSVMEENKLYLNKGNFRFEDVTQRAGVGLAEGIKTGVSIVDINGDGWLDIYQCRTGETLENRDNKLFINNGDGTFSEQSEKFGLNLNSPSTASSFFDYDADGDLDVYIINRPADFATNSQVYVEEVDGKIVRNNKPQDEFESDRLYRNNGNGTFTDVSKQAGIQNRTFSLSVNVVDINEDGFPDIYVANDYLEPDNMYINNGDGTFTDQWQQYFRHFSHFSMGSDIGDFNNDGLLDIVTLDMLPKDNYRQKQNGSVMSLTRYNNLVKYGYGHQIMRNMLHLNNGNGSFSEIACLSGISHTDWSWAPLFADFDNDGWKDIFVTNGFKKDVGDLDFVNYVMDSLKKAGTNISDFSQLLDLLPSKKLRNYMFRNTGGIRTEDVSQAWGFKEETFSNGAVYIDLDEDGDLDTVVHNTDDPAMIYKNETREKGEGNYLRINLEGPPKNAAGVGAEVVLSANGKTQTLQKYLNRGFFSSFHDALHFGLGNASSAESLEIRWPDGKTQTLQNVSANQTITFKYADATPGSKSENRAVAQFKEITGQLGLDYTHIENIFEDFARERLLPRRYSDRGPCLAVADVNADGLADVYIGGSIQQKGLLLLQKSDGSFALSSQSSFESSVAHEDVDAIFFDANGDAAPDLYVVSGGTEAPLQQDYYNDRLYINDGKGNFNYVVSALPRFDESGSCVAVSDFDNDGDLDLARGGNVKPGAFPLVSKSFLLENNNGTFRDVTATLAPEFAEIGIVKSIIFTDLDKSGNAEMVVTGDWMPITVFKTGKSGFKNISDDLGLQDTEGWWACLAAGDFNGDGYNDLFAGNLGLNCRLTASAREPVEIYAIDIDNNGTIDPIMTYYNDGLCHPLTHRDMLIAQVPAMKKKFVRYKKYSGATIDDVLSEDLQEKSLRLKASVFGSSVFLSDGNGKLIRHELPFEAQIAPIQDATVRDLNQDGKLDLIAVGNDYGLEIESGRMDAGNGWVLSGDGKGGFTVIPNLATGFWATKDAREIKILDRKDGSMLILVANNNEALQVFRSTSKPVF